MTKEEVRYLLRRYRYISCAIQKEHISAFISISDRKERIPITNDILKFSDTVLKTLKKVKDDFSRTLLEHWVFQGESDVNIYVRYGISRGTYYTMKEAFVERLFCFCIFQGLVTEDEI